MIFGLANQHSLAVDITKLGGRANLAITYQGERFEPKIKKLVANHLKTSSLLLPAMFKMMGKLKTSTVK